MDDKVCISYRRCYDPTCPTHIEERQAVLRQTPTTPTLGIKSALKYVMAANSNICQLCFYPCFGFQDSENTTIAPSVDHIIEARDGGTLSVGNIRLAHRFCNSAREFFPDPRTHPKFQRKVVDKLAVLLKEETVAV